MFTFTSSNNNKMTTQEYNDIAKAKLNKLSTSDLITEVKKLANNYSDAAMLVSQVAFDILIERMPESEFVALCNEL